MRAKQPNIVFLFWEDLGWGEVGCYGGGVLRGAPTPRIDRLATGGLRLLNFNVEARCTPSRSVVLTGRHAIRSGTQLVPIAGGLDGLTRWAAERASECIIQVVTVEQPPADLLASITPGIRELVEAELGLR